MMNNGTINENQRNELIQIACDLRSRAYAPQSGFYVGAAVLADDGTIYRGVNVENSSYGLTCCAERTALFAAISDGQKPDSFTAIVVASKGGASPCGACRQVICELAENAVIYLVDADSPLGFEETTLETLLPRSFKLPPRH